MKRIVFAVVFFAFVAVGAAAEKLESAVKGNGNRVAIAVVDSRRAAVPRVPDFRVVTYEVKVVEEPGLPLMKLTLNGVAAPPDLMFEVLGELRDDLDLLQRPLRVDVRPLGNAVIPPDAGILPVALLLRSVILGDRLDDEIVVAARVSVPWDPDLGLYRLHGHPPLNLDGILAAGFSKVAIPNTLGSLIDDFAIRGEWAKVHGTQVWSVGKVKDAYELLVVKDDENASRSSSAVEGGSGDGVDAEEVKQRFKETQALLEERGISMVANPHVMERVSNMLTLHPNHQTANLYLRYGEGAPPKHLSLIGSAEGLRVFFVLEIRPAIEDLYGRSDSEVRGMKRDLRKRLEEVSKNVHPEAKGVVVHLEKIEDFITQFHQSDAATIQKIATDFDAWRELFDKEVEDIVSDRPARSG